MTTIAYRNGILAADTGITGSSSRFATTRKILKREDGWMCGFSGDLGDLADAHYWFMNAFLGSFCINMNDNSEILLISPSGLVSLAFSESKPVRIEAPFYATGSGMKFAYGAMEAGVDAIEAVRISSIYDVNTFGPIESLKLT